MRWIPDRTGRFAERPYWSARDLDAQCERVIATFLRERWGEVSFPVSTEDLTVLVEGVTDDFDSFADLTSLGNAVEGVTEFREGRRPVVRIDRRLASDTRRHNRLRTTLTHEYGHVLLHSTLWASSPSRGLFPDADLAPHASSCHTATMVTASQTDWMEWQASYASGALLMPQTQMGALVAAFQSSAGRAGHVQLGTDDALELVRQVQRTFAVSQEAARMRLGKLGYLRASAVPERGLFPFGG